MPFKSPLAIALVCGTSVLAGCATGSRAKTAKVIPQAPAGLVAPSPVVATCCHVAGYTNIFRVPGNAKSTNHL